MKKSGKTFLKILISIIVVIAIIAGGIATTNAICLNQGKSFINSIDKAEYENQLVPALADDGSYTFTTNREFKVMQITDVHLGGGFISKQKDKMALNAVASMVKAEKPDLVVVTGDIAFPVPYIAGTFNNKSGEMLFAELMESLGVYWCLAYGNHDTEAYSYYTRKEISKFYENKEKYPHCLFQSGDEKVDGYGNYVINVKNTDGGITQSLFMIDSNSYCDGDPLGIKWSYDCVHENQIEWYKSKVAELTKENNAITPKSLAFMHIPVIEFRDAYEEYCKNNYQDTDRVKYVYGTVGEEDEKLYPSELNNGLFGAFLSEKSTQGAFFGHDHLNNLSLTYDGIRLTYGMSIDYLAYSDIDKFGLQRGCTIINIDKDGNFECNAENYYQDKYESPAEKEKVSMEPYYSK